MDFCTEEGRNYYKNKPSKECCCLPKLFYYIFFILSEIFFYILYVFFKLCNCMPHYGEMVGKNITTLKAKQTALENASTGAEKNIIERYYDKEMKRNYNDFFNNVKNKV